jgi:hypothetical protein
MSTDQDDIGAAAVTGAGNFKIGAFNTLCGISLLADVIALLPPFLRNISLRRMERIRMKTLCSPILPASS